MGLNFTAYHRDLLDVPLTNGESTSDHFRLSVCVVLMSNLSRSLFLLLTAEPVKNLLMWQFWGSSPCRGNSFGGLPLCQILRRNFVLVFMVLYCGRWAIQQSVLFVPLGERVYWEVGVFHIIHITACCQLWVVICLYWMSCAVEALHLSRVV